MSLLHAMAIGSTGLTAQRSRMETIASNLANARTTRTAGGGPYRRLQPVFVAEPLAAPGAGDPVSGALRWVRVAAIQADASPFVLRYEPGHPDADERGYVAYPNVDPVREMVDMLSATRSYEANVTVVRAVRDLLGQTLKILV